MNQLKQDASAFYANSLLLERKTRKVYMNCKPPHFTLDDGFLYIGDYNQQTDGRDFFLDVIQRLREYTKEYAIQTSLSQLQYEESE